MNFSHKNYGKQNTPDVAQKVGDILLAVGSVGAGILLIPAAPAALVTAATYMSIAGLLGKAITKCFGKQDPDRKLTE